MSDDMIEQIANTIIEIGETSERTEKELETLKLKFKSFCMAVLKNLPKEASKRIFKEYQRNSFKSDAE